MNIPDPRPLYIRRKPPIMANSLLRPNYCTRCQEDDICQCGFCSRCDVCPCQLAMLATAAEENFLIEETGSEDPADWEDYE